MQRVGAERGAFRRRRDAREAAPAEIVDDNRHREDAEDERAGLDRRGRPGEPAQRLGQHPDGQHDEHAGLHQRGHRLDLRVAVVVRGVGGPVGGAHGEQSEQRRADVDEPVRRLAQQRQRAGHEAGGELGEGERGARPDGIERGALFLACGVAHREGFLRTAARISAALLPFPVYARS